MSKDVFNVSLSTHIKYQVEKCIKNCINYPFLALMSRHHEELAISQFFGLIFFQHFFFQVFKKVFKRENYITSLIYLLGWNCTEPVNLKVQIYLFVNQRKDIYFFQRKQKIVAIK